MDNEMINYIDFYGDSEQGFSGSIRDFKITAKEAGLKACKFCGSKNAGIVNTHTPCYWVECECGIELSPHHIAEDGESYSDLALAPDNKDLDSVKGAHKESLAHIIKKWNA